VKSSVTWLKNLWRGRAEHVHGAYRRRLDPSDPEAKVILADLALYCNVGHSSFVAGDPYQTAFNEGARDAFLHVAAIVDLRPEDFPGLIEVAQD